MGRERGQIAVRDRTRARNARAADLEPLARFLRLVAPRTVTLSELAEEYLREAPPSPGSDRAAIIRRHVVEAFGAGLDPRALGAPLVEAWLRALAAAGYAETTRLKHLSHLSCVLAYGRRTGALEHDPIADLDPAVRPGRSPRDPERTAREMLSAAEVVRVIRSPAIRPINRLLWSVLLLTGARIGEAVGFCWRDYDPGARPLGRLRLERQWRMRVGGFGPTKDRGAREVPVHTALAFALDRGRALFRARFGRDPGTDDPLCPFEHRDRPHEPRRWEHCTVLARWRRDLEIVGLDPDRTVHSTRHTFVSMLANAGAPERPARSLTHAVGGGSAYERYVHLSWEAKCAAVMTLDLGGTSK